MKNRFVAGLLAFVGALHGAAAQDVVIANARILDGTGRAIERGTVVVRNGRIESVSESVADVPGVERLDARGMTVMPGFIDAHRHLIQGNPAQWLESQAAASMQAFLEAGFTTLFSAIDATEQILALRQRLADGEIAGLRRNRNL